MEVEWSQLELPSRRYEFWRVNGFSGIWEMINSIGKEYSQEYSREHERISGR
jgi:hypothetical protein